MGTVTNSRNTRFFRLLRHYLLKPTCMHFRSKTYAEYNVQCVSGLWLFKFMERRNLMDGDIKSINAYVLGSQV